jgi:hypothetical protein
MFHNAADGYWGLESHKLSRQDLVDRALTFNADSIRPILSHWQKLNVSGLFVGTNYHGPSGRFAHELNADDLSSYFNSRGEAYFQNIIDKVYSPELQSLMFRANKLMTKMKVFSTETGDMTMFNLIFTPGSYLCIVAPHGDFNDLDGWIHEIENLPKSEVADEFLQLAKDIKIYRETTFLPVKEMEPLAILDLVVWKDEHVVSCEVKAPNDRLKPHQKAQLERDNNNGIASWVIEVEEA